MNEKVVDWEGNEERKGCKREKNQLENLLEEFLWYSPTSTDESVTEESSSFSRRLYTRAAALSGLGAS